MPVTIIAEAGVNHNGSLEMAKRMALAAKECGADIVKYQTAVPELVVSKFAEKAEYQKQTTDAAESQLEMIRKLHFSFEGHRELKEYCDSIGIQYLSAPFDIPSVRFLGTLGLPLIKIPSGEITNLPYLEEVAKLHTPVLLSTGMSNLNEITDALAILDDGGCPEVTILHCNTQYPTPYEDANLTAMLELFDQFGLPVGLSDHTPGWECDVAATVLGAQVIEKHFTLDKSLPGPDQKASLDPTEFKAMVDAVRHVEAALGDGHKHLTESEAPNKAVARKSIVAARAIQAGETFTTENLTTKRPGDGISPMRWYEVLGKTAKRDFAEDEKIELERGPYAYHLFCYRHPGGIWPAAPRGAKAGGVLHPAIAAGSHRRSPQQAPGRDRPGDRGGRHSHRGPPAHFYRGCRRAGGPDHRPDLDGV